MKKFLTTLIVLSIFCLNGCGITQSGNTLYSFTEKMNNIDESYNLTEADYIYDHAEQSVTKFYVINSHIYTLSLDLNDQNRIEALHIVFDNSSVNNSTGMKFIKDCVLAYTENNDAVNRLESILTKRKSTPSYKSVTKKIGNTDLIIDITDIGTIISVVQNNL